MWNTNLYTRTVKIPRGVSNYCTTLRNHLLYLLTQINARYALCNLGVLFISITSACVKSFVLDLFHARKVLFTNLRFYQTRCVLTFDLRRNDSEFDDFKCRLSVLDINFIVRQCLTYKLLIESIFNFYQG